MKTMRKRLLAAAVLAGLMAPAFGAGTAGVTPPPAPDAPDAPDAPPGRPEQSAPSPAERRRELAARLREVWDWPQVLDEPEKLGTYAPRAIPLVEELAAVEAEAAAADPAKASVPLGVRDQLLALGCLLGDKKATEELAASARSRDPAEKAAAEAASLLSQWWRAGHDARAQSAILDRMPDLLGRAAAAPAAAAPAAADRVAGILFAMRDRAATPQIAARAEEILVTARPRGPRAAAFLETWDKRRREEQRAREQAFLAGQLGKPIALAGTTFEGREFSTSDWKGRVVLVDFWATWCGPCVQSLPDVDRAYTKYHGRGLEVVGVCCDWEREPVGVFRAAHPFMKWPDLFQPGHENDLHPLALQCGVHAIPTYFLIDKKGVLRKIVSGAGELAEDKTKAFVEELLAEP